MSLLARIKNSESIVIDMRLGKYMCAAVSLLFLAIHVGMLILFWCCGVMPMVYFNIFSIVFYLCSFYFIYKEQLRAYSALVYLEVLCHMALATMLTGWDNGFQITLIGIGVLLFFSEYMGHALNIATVNEWINAADELLYQGKANGKNQVVS